MFLETSMRRSPSGDFADALDVPMDWQCLPDSVFESKVIPMQASAGFPYHCAFCNFTRDRRLTYSSSPKFFFY